jgi:hypothetical protein
LATAPLTTTNFILKATGTTIGNSLIFDNGTNVGIGNTNTTYKLEVTGTGYFSGIVGIGVAPSAWYNLNGYVALQIGNASLFGRNSANSELYLSSNVYDNSSGDATYITTDFASRYIQNDGTHTWLSAPSGTAGAAVTLTPRMTILQGGNVGIGTSSPNERLYVYNNAGTNPTGTVISVETAGSTAGYGAEVKLINSNSSGRTYGIRSSGPGDGLVGSYKFAIIDYTANAGRLIIDSSGVVTISNLGSGAVTATSGVLSTTSDMTLKIEDGFIDNALEKVMNLKPRYFHWKEESGLPTDIRQLGFYAQEVNEAIGEEAANTPKNENDKWGIYDRALIAMLTKAVQELKAEIDELKNK